ncbi:Spy/CpxP family protein refolding chaperone [Niabella soli]|uniref:Periplasmic heavy metal sensor n=1 Tax=Niabella soli DSM 19437 TaxID=929713 RepID=W0F7G9_9BACT|nr:hypothetical protein [Niabella soli]AHF17748.1 hypothetical protein NIASO_13615 [Niabella soli DSM 19437]
MNSTSRSKSLIFVIIILLITNIALLVYTFVFLKRGPQDHKKDGFTSALRKEVGFSDDQIKQFNVLKEKSWAAAKADMEHIRRIKQALFDLTKETSVSDSAVILLADSIAKLQKGVEINTFRHFKETRQICTPEQMPKYDSLMKKIIRQGRPGRPVGGPPPK